MGIGTKGPGQRGNVSPQESLESDIAGTDCARLLPQCKIAAIGIGTSGQNVFVRVDMALKIVGYQVGRGDLSRWSVYSL